MSRRKKEPKGYGNIYTPHAGSMIIQVQREGGLANRTLVLSPRQVGLLRFFGSRIGIGVGVLAVASWAFFAIQAARVPLLTGRIVRMERDAKRLDTLERALSTLQVNYSQVQHMLGASPAARSAQTMEAGGTNAVRTTRPAAGRVAAAPIPAPAPALVPAPAIDTTRPDTTRPDTTRPDTTRPDTTP